FSTNAMHYVVWTYDNSAHSSKVYVDGTLQSTVAYTMSGTDSTSTGINAAGGSSGISNGTFDEFRVSNSVRTADWITTEYRNQNAPGSFLTLGAQEVSPPSQVTLTSPISGASNQSTLPTLSWLASSNATSYDLYLGTSSSPAVYA